MRKAITREGHVVVVRIKEYTPLSSYPYVYTYVHPVYGTRYDVSNEGRHKWGDESKDVVGWVDVLEQRPKATHTPGPWTVGVPSFDVLGLGCLSGIHGEAFVICDMCVGYPKETQEANARLIAAAPELFELAKRVMNLNPFGDREIYEAKITATELINKVEGK